MMTYREFVESMMMCGDTLATVEGIPPLSLPKSKGKALKDYRVYGQSQQNGTPTPSNPIEVESVGEKTKNLFDGTITNWANTGTVGYNSNYRGITIPVVAGETYTFKRLSLPPIASSNRCGYFFTKESPYAGLALYKAVNLPQTTLTFTVTIPAECTYFVAYFDVGGIDITGTQMMFVQGTTAPTEYEPYNKYKIPLAICNNPAFANLPSEYQQVEYLESHGTEYIDTGINVGTIPNFNLDLDFSSLLEPDVADAGVVFICRNNWDFNSYCLFYRKNESGWRFHGKGQIVADFSANTRYRYTTNCSNNTGTLSLYDGTEYTHSLGNNSNLTNLNLFGFNRYSYRINIRIYGLKCYNETTLIGNFIPARRKSDSVLGMYDLVTNTFFTNQGTGTFTCGADINGTTTNIYLNAPLRKIGNYADYIDFKGQKVVRNYEEKVLEGTESWSFSSARKLFVLSIGRNVVGQIRCTHLVNISYTTALTEDGCGDIFVDCVFISRHEYDGDLSSFKAWLASQYANNTPVKLYYPLVTPTEESIALPSVPTIKGQCYFKVLTDIQPSNSQVKYLK